jgi:hypothetical protein
VARAPKVSRRKTSWAFAQKSEVPLSVQRKLAKHPQRRKANEIDGRALDAVAREAIDRCADVIARCGYSPQESARRFQQRFDRVPAAVVQRAASTSKDIDLTAHVLTLWSQEREYLLPDGRMRPLRATGRAPSIEALVHKVGRGLTTKSALANFSSTGSLRRVGRMYVPYDTWVAHPSNSPSQHAHHMRVFVEFLRTLDHNTRVRRMDDRWYQFAADNASIPVSQIAALNHYLRATGHSFLREKDAMMYRMARKRRNNELTQAVSIGVYLSQPRRPSDPRRYQTRKAK